MVDPGRVLWLLLAGLVFGPWWFLKEDPSKFGLWILMVDPVGGSWWWIPWIKVLHNGGPQQPIQVY